MQVVQNGYSWLVLYEESDDLSLIHIFGRELRADRLIDFKKAITNEHYQNLIGKDDEDSKWMRTVYEREYLLSMKETDLFKELEEVLEGKEYFVVRCV